MGLPSVFARGMRWCTIYWSGRRMLCYDITRSSLCTRRCSFRNHLVRVVLPEGNKAILNK